MTRYSVAGKRLSPYFAGSGVKMVHLFTSGDGLRFEPAGDEPMLTCDWPNAFDSHNIFFWSEVEQPLADRWNIRVSRSLGLGDETRGGLLVGVFKSAQCVNTK